MADGAGGGGKRRESIDAIRRQCQRRDAERPTRRRIQYPLMYIFSIFLPFFFFFIIFSSSSSSSSSDTGPSFGRRQVLRPSAVAPTLFSVRPRAVGGSSISKATAAATTKRKESVRERRRHRKSETSILEDGRRAL